MDVRAPGERRRIGRMSDRRLRTDIARSVVRTGRMALALLAVALPAVHAEAALGFRKVITVQAGQVASGPHANFPLLVSLVDPNLATVPNGGNVTSDSGYDIVFRGEDATTCGGPATCRLDHEIERYDPTNGTLIAWVRVPSINDGTPVYLYYGDATLTRPTEAPSAVWEPDSPATPGYVGVWHLKEAGTTAPLEFKDSSKNANHGQGGEGDPLFLPAQIAGKIGLGQDFSAGAANPRDAPPPDGKWDVIDAGHSARLLGGDQITLQAWIRHNIAPALGHFYGFLSYKGASAGYRLVFEQNTLRLNFSLPASNVLTTGSISTGAWHHVVATYDGATMRVYIDGAQDPTTAARVGPIIPATGGDAELFIGHGDQQKDKTWSYPWVGQMDEVRISRVARSAGWILTEYRSQNAPGSFYSVGAQTAGPYATPSFTLLTVNHRSIGTNGGVLHGTGNASVALGSTTVDFGGGANLPTNVGIGDTLTFPGAPAETLYVLSRNSATQVTVQTPATAAHTNQTYAITRSFTTLAAWETARQGDLVTENRREVGVAYNDGPFTTGVDIAGWTTDSLRYPMLIPAAGHRHDGTAGTGVVLDGVDTDQGIRVSTSHTVVDGFEFRRIRGADSAAAVVVQNSGYDVLLRNLLAYDFADPTHTVSGIRGQSESDYMVRNSIIYGGDTSGIRNNSATAFGIVDNVTVYGMAEWGVLASAGSLVVRNTISMGNPSGDFSGTMIQGYNMSSDATASGSQALTGRLASDQFVSVTPGSEDLHLKAGSEAIDTAYPAYMPQYWTDIDGAPRLFTPIPMPPTLGPWDRGADEFGATTAVELVSFAARGLDSGVELTWETGSETNNLGFHLDRSFAAEGPWERLTTSLIPGLGSSPEGARYAYTDAGLQNGRTCFYRLEDVETTGVATHHGPVSATPEAGAGSGAGGGEGDTADESDGDGGAGEPGDGDGAEEDGGGPAESDGEGDTGDESDGHPGDGGPEGGDGAEPLVFGDPERTSVRVVKKSGRSLVLELRTGGFRATPQGDGTMRLDVPGFEWDPPPGWPAVPSRLTWVDAMAGRKVEIASVRATDVVTYDLRPTRARAPALVVAADGTVATVERRVRARRLGAGLFPDTAAAVLETAFQGETKKALVRLSPLRFDAGSGRLVLARRLVVRLVFRSRAKGEVSLGGSRGRLERRGPPRSGVLARLATRAAGLHAVAFEDLFPGRSRPMEASLLRVSRRGEAVVHRIEPDPRVFAPGSRLYFLSPGPETNPDGPELVYELERAPAGLAMATRDASPAGGPVVESQGSARFERNVRYMPSLLEAPDRWLWDAVGAATARTFPFDLEGVSASTAPARLVVRLVGGSDYPVDPDHHVRVLVNGGLVAETSWDGLTPRTIEAAFDSSLLHEGANALEIHNVGDTAAAASFVHLDRFEIAYPQSLAPPAGRFEGRFLVAGAATIAGLAGAHLLDTTEDHAVWLSGAQPTPAGLRFRAEAGRRYLAVAAGAVASPEVRAPARSTLLDRRNGATHLVLAPREFLEAAEILVQHRQAQGLLSRAVAVEEVFDVFGHGESHSQAVQDFLAYAFHHWSEGPRYVLLLGDASYDPKDFLGTGVRSLIPTPIVATRYLWTAADPLLAAVNGADPLPDLAIGRLPAATREQALALVRKLVDYEEAGLTPRRDRVVLVADDSDGGGNFESHADEIAGTLLAGRDTLPIRVSQHGTATRAAILDAFDQGASLMSYMGHGSTLIWAGENVFNVWDLPALRAQTLQPLVLTLNCLNGYFTMPTSDALGEALVKAEGRGAIAAFSPSSLSLDGAAHAYHKALLGQILSGRHARLGDAIMAAQAEYGTTAALPELVWTYHLFADPAMVLR